MWSRKEFSKLSSCTPATLVYYERLGLVKPKRNPENNYRIYDNDHLQIMRLITVLKYSNFSLSSIQVLLGFLNKPFSKECKKETTEIFEKQITYLEKNIAIQEQILNYLTDFVSQQSAFNINDTHNYIKKIYNNIKESNQFENTFEM